jgi:hypothetical protein
MLRIKLDNESRLDRNAIQAFQRNEKEVSTCYRALEILNRTLLL